MTTPPPVGPRPPYDDPHHGARAPQPSATASHAPQPHTGAGRSLPLSVLVGVLAGIAGLLPHFIDGAMLPPQNLGVRADSSFSLLPLNQYHVVSVAVLLLFGGVAAGTATRALNLCRLPAMLGLLGTHVVILAQSCVALTEALGIFDSSADTRSYLYLFGLSAAAVLSAAAAQGLFWLCSARPVGAAALGFCLAAVAATNWVSALVVELFGPTPTFWSDVARWAPAVLVGVALAWCGVRPPQRIAVWVAGLLALWLLPTLIIAVNYALGIRLIAGDVAEMYDAGSQVFASALSVNAEPLPVALVIGVLGAGAVEVARRNRRTARTETRTPSTTPTVEAPRGPFE